MKFIIEQSDEHLTPVAGLALVGEIIDHTAKLNKFAFFIPDRQENAPQIAKTSWK